MERNTDWDAELTQMLREAFILLEKEREMEIPEECTFSRRFKRKMNRLFREQAGMPDSRIPHPEVDTAYERFRSRIVRFFLVLIDRAAKGWRRLRRQQRN